MKGILKMLIVALMIGGCVNIGERSGERGRPILCAFRPYDATGFVWRECIFAPVRGIRMRGPDGMWYAMATATWPFWVFDEVCEVCLDTAFLPVDVIYMKVRD